MKRGGPLKRKARLEANPATTREWQDRSRKPLPQVNARTAAKRRKVTAAGAAAKARDARCVAAPLVPEVTCWGEYDPQHVIPRGVDPANASNPANIVGICRGHHRWIDTNKARARRLGLHGHYGDDLAELARRRSGTHPT